AGETTGVDLALTLAPYSLEEVDLVVEVDAGSPAPHNPSRLAVALAELHVGDGLRHGVPCRLCPRRGDHFGGDHLAGARRDRPLAPGSCAPTPHRAEQPEPRDPMEPPYTTQGARYAAPPRTARIHPRLVNPRSHPASRISSGPPACRSPTLRSGGAGPWRDRSSRRARSSVRASRAARAPRGSSSSARTASPARTRDPS